MISAPAMTRHLVLMRMTISGFRGNSQATRDQTAVNQRLPVASMAHSRNLVSKGTFRMKKLYF